MGYFEDKDKRTLNLFFEKTPKGVKKSEVKVKNLAHGGTLRIFCSMDTQITSNVEKINRRLFKLPKQIKINSRISDYMVTSILSGNISVNIFSQNEIY